MLQLFFYLMIARNPIETAQVGIEPTHSRLTVERSTIVPLSNKLKLYDNYITNF